MWKVEDVKCDVVRCEYNNNCHCTAEKVSIALTHDEISENEYIICETIILEN